MSRDSRRLDDILATTKKIAVRAHDGRERFDNDEERQAALERWVGIIGEAAACLSSELKDAYPEVSWPRIVAMRNRLVHDYLNIDLDILWDVVSVEVPTLAEQIAEIIQDLEWAAEGDS